MGKDRKFFKIATACLMGFSVLSLVVIAFNCFDNYRYETKGVATNGTVVAFTLKRGSTSAGSSGMNSLATGYPVIEYLDEQGLKQQFTSNYSTLKFGIGETIPLRYLKEDKPNERIDIFSINWLFSIFAAIILAICAVFIFVIRQITSYYIKKEKYVSTLTGKCFATVIAVVKYKNGWKLLLDGTIKEQDNTLFQFTYFTFFEPQNLIGKTIEVNYDPLDIEKSYLIEPNNLEQ